MKVCFLKKDIILRTMNNSYRKKNFFKLKLLMLFVFAALLLTGKPKKLYAESDPAFTLKLPAKTLKANKLFEISFTLSFAGDANAFDIKSFTFNPDKEIEIIKSSSVTTTDINKNDKAITSTVFLYTLKTNETDIALPQTELLLTDATGQTITLNTQESFLSLKPESQFFKNTITKIKSNKMIIWIVAGLVILVLFFAIIIADHKLGKTNNK